MSVLMIPRKQNPAADVGKGLLGLAGTIALVVGVPAALVAWVGSPLPAGVPSVSDVTGALRDTYIPDEFLVKLLALVCWLVWIELVASLLVEAVAYARGRKAGSVPLAGGLQRGAARLVATIALLGVLVAGRGTSTPERSTQPLAAVAHHPVTMSLVVDEQAAADVGHAGSTAAAAPAAAAPTYEVQRRDTLWDIAERHLGDPFRWQEIFDLNQGCPQADGGCLTDPDLIFAGWRLQLPADAVGLVDATVAPASGPPEAPAAPEAPAPPTTPDSSSVVLDGGMVLISDGAGGSRGPAGAGDVLVVSGSASVPGSASAAGAAVGGAAGRGGMVLLPDDAFGGPAGPEGTPVLAGPPHDGAGGGSDTAAPAGTAAAGAFGPADAPRDDDGDDGGPVADELASAPEAPPRPRSAGHDE